MLLGFSTIYLALKKIRDTDFEGKISFGKAFRIALLMMALVALIYAVVWILYVQINGNEFMATFFQNSISEVRESEQTAAEKEALIAELESQFSFYKKPL